MMRRWLAVIAVVLIFCFVAFLRLNTHYDGRFSDGGNPKSVIVSIDKAISQHWSFLPLVVSRDYFVGLQRSEPDGTQRDYIDVTYDSRDASLTLRQGHQQLRRIYGISRADIHQVAAQNGDLDDLAKLGW